MSDFDIPATQHNPDTPNPETPDAPAAAKRPARKRAAKKTPAPIDTGDPASGQPSVTGQAGSQDAAPASAEPAPTARRRARKTAASAADPTSSDAAAVPTANAHDRGAETEPAKKAARKRTPKKAAETPTTDTPTIAAAAVPAVFQAPDPTLATTPRRRTRKQAAPSDDSAQAAAVSTDGSTDGPTDGPTEGSTQSSTAPQAGARQPARRTRQQRAAADQTPPTETGQANAAQGEEAPATQDRADPDEEQTGGRRRRRRGGRRHKRAGGEAESGAEGEGGTESGSQTPDQPGRAGANKQPAAAKADTSNQADGEAGNERPGDAAADDATPGDGEDGDGTTRRRRRRRRRKGEPTEGAPDDPEDTVVRVREPRSAANQVTSLEGSTRLQAKKQRRRENRDAGKRRPSILTESEFLARRESVERVMAVRQRGELTQIAVIEDGVLVEHYVSQVAQTSQIGNIHLGRVQNVLPSMEAAFVDIGKGRNAILYAGEVDWVALGLNGQPKKIEAALKSGQSVLVQVSKDPVGQKGARLTSQISLAGRYVVFVPGGGMSGISRKLPDTERSRLKDILRGLVPEGASVVVRTAAEGATEEELRNDVERLQSQWAEIEAQVGKGQAPKSLYVEPDLLLKVVRDLFNSDFARLEVSGPDAGAEVLEYVAAVAPHLGDRVTRAAADEDVFARYDIDDQIAKALQRKVWLPSGGSLVIDRTEAMTVVDVNTGKFTGSGGSLEETVTKNNLEAAEEIVRQLRLRDLGGIVVIDFIDMVLEANRELVLRRLVECLGRDRTKHQVAEVTSLGLVQMTRKRIGIGLLEAFSEPCPHCGGRGLIIHDHPKADTGRNQDDDQENGRSDGRSGRNGRNRNESKPVPAVAHGPNPAEIIAAAAARSRSAEHPDDGTDAGGADVDGTDDDQRGSDSGPEDVGLLELDLSRPAGPEPTPTTAESLPDAGGTAPGDTGQAETAPGEDTRTDEAPTADSTTTGADQVNEGSSIDAAGSEIGGDDAAPAEVAQAGAPSGMPADAQWIGTTDGVTEKTSAVSPGAGTDGEVAGADAANADSGEAPRSAEPGGASRPRRRRGRRGGRSRRDEAPAADPLADGSDPSDFEPADLSPAEV